MPNLTITVTAEQASRIIAALAARYGDEGSTTFKAKLLLRDLVREYEAGEARRIAFEAADDAYQNEEDWGE